MSTDDSPRAAKVKPLAAVFDEIFGPSKPLPAGCDDRINYHATGCSMFGHELWFHLLKAAERAQSDGYTSAEFAAGPIWVVIDQVWGAR